MNDSEYGIIESLMAVFKKAGFKKDSDNTHQCWYTDNDGIYVTADLERNCFVFELENDDAGQMDCQIEISDKVISRIKRVVKWVENKFNAQGVLIVEISNLYDIIEKNDISQLDCDTVEIKINSLKKAISKIKRSRDNYPW